MQDHDDIAKRLTQIFDLAGTDQEEVAALINSAMESDLTETSIDDFITLFRSLGFPERENPSLH